MRLHVRAFCWFVFIVVIATSHPRSGVAQNQPAERQPYRIALIDIGQAAVRTNRIVDQFRQLRASYSPDTPKKERERHEAMLTIKIYKEIVLEVGEYARENQISLVLSYDSGGNWEGPSCAVPSGKYYLDQWIVYPSQQDTREGELDITDHIVERLVRSDH